ncbi:aminotransferase class III-fold pyridoxal phosphate-dependent enzyme [Legionella sp. D16C41]|uniref:aminotransferase class III-fold pyridoxal phosphate-dependent enzyme n=1 Tax=Legionella sp. D16C41 TaxID=3402688 RepID=UPI003AF8120A
MNTKEKDKKFLARNTEAFDSEISRADGSVIYDVNNKKYIDFTSGWCVGNFGWNDKKLKEKINEFNGPDYIYPSYLYSPWADLAELLAQITPGNLTKSFQSNSTESKKFDQICS